MTRSTIPAALRRAAAKTLSIGVFTGGICLVAVVGADALNAEGADTPPNTKAERRTPLVETVISEARMVPATLKLRGVTEAARSVTVSAQTAGLVVSEPRRKGARIAKGETLCEIETGDRKARLAEAKARLLEAEAVAKASTELGKRGFSAETTRAKDRAALEAARAAVTAMELDIERTRMTAPFDGWLETDTAELGALLSLGAPCATLLSLNPIRFVGHSAESEISKISLGQPVTAVMIDGREVRAEISFVARAADPKTRTFRVEAAAPNPEDAPGGPVRDGATATLLIAHGEHAAHKAPRSALMLNDGGRLGVMLAEDGMARFQPVEVLSDGADGVWIGGPPERAEIIITGQYYVADGAPVRAAPRQSDDAGAKTTEDAQ